MLWTVEYQLVDEQKVSVCSDRLVWSLAILLEREQEKNISQVLSGPRMLKTRVTHMNLI